MGISIVVAVQRFLQEYVTDAKQLLAEKEIAILNAHDSSSRTATFVETKNAYEAFETALNLYDRIKQLSEYKPAPELKCWEQTVSKWIDMEKRSRFSSNPRCAWSFEKPPYEKASSADNLTKYSDWAITDPSCCATKEAATESSPILDAFIESSKLATASLAISGDACEKYGKLACVGHYAVLSNLNF